MFTILVRYQKTRREVLTSARSVEFVRDKGEGEPGLLINPGIEGEAGCFLGVSEKGDENWRDVFVMNDQGQTVARYIL